MFHVFSRICLRVKLVCSSFYVVFGDHIPSVAVTNRPRLNGDHISSSPAFAGREDRSTQRGAAEDVGAAARGASGGGLIKEVDPPHRIHVWYIYIYMLTKLGYIDGKCYHIWHTYG